MLVTQADEGGRSNAKASGRQLSLIVACDCRAGLSRRRSICSPTILGL
jgi:hypothetical protein